MVKNKFILTFLIFSFLNANLVLLNAENFRVYKTHIVDFSVDYLQSKKVSAGVSDAVVVKLPKDLIFIQGIAFEVKIPQIVASYHDSVAYSVYKNVTPNPKAGVIDYSGQRLGIETFPAKLSYNIQLPLIKNHQLKTSPYSVLLEPLSEDVETIFLRLQQVMKGTPAEFFDALFVIDVKPVLIDKGMLNLSFEKPEGVEGDFVVYVDEVEVLDYSKGLLLNTGIHHLSVVSDFFRNEVRSVTIEQGQFTNVAIELKDLTPTLQVIAPENTIVELDGVILEQNSKVFTITEGEHQVKLSVGNYETVRTINAQKGKTYKVSLSVEVDIVEE